MSRRIIGRYIVADDAICHGKPTIAGTRILVADVLSMIVEGYSWYGIGEAWGGKITDEALAELVSLVGRAFHDHAEEYVVETVAEPVTA